MTDQALRPEPSPGQQLDSCPSPGRQRPGASNLLETGRCIIAGRMKLVFADAGGTLQIAWAGAPEMAQLLPRHPSRCFSTMSLPRKLTAARCSVREGFVIISWAAGRHETVHHRCQNRTVVLWSSCEDGTRASTVMGAANVRHHDREILLCLTGKFAHWDTSNVQSRPKIIQGCPTESDP